MLQTDTGDVFEAPVPETLREEFDVGAEAFVEVDPVGVLQRWWLATRPDGALRPFPRFAR